jgi:uncharacterized OB-fold protein
MSKKPPLIIDVTSAPFWEGVKHHKLLLQYDKKAARFQFFPRPISLYTSDGVLEWRESKGTGTLVAYTLTYFRAPGFEDEIPYLEGLIHLNEGPRIFAPITGTTYEALAVGMRMRIAWPDRPERIHPYQFEIAA